MWLHIPSGTWWDQGRELGTTLHILSLFLLSTCQIGSWISRCTLRNSVTLRSTIITNDLNIWKNIKHSWPFVLFLLGWNNTLFLWSSTSVLGPLSGSDMNGWFLSNFIEGSLVTCLRLLVYCRHVVQKIFCGSWTLWRQVSKKFYT